MGRRRVVRKGSHVRGVGVDKHVLDHLTVPSRIRGQL